MCQNQLSNVSILGDFFVFGNKSITTVHENTCDDTGFRKGEGRMRLLSDASALIRHTVYFQFNIVEHLN